MKKILIFFKVFIVISASVNVISCSGFETQRDRNKISLTLFTSELALIPLFERQKSTKVVTETMFQNSIYDALETNEYCGNIASGELEFIYYNQNLTPIIWTDLPWQQTISGGEKTVLLRVKIIANSSSDHFINETDVISTTLYKTQLLALDNIKFNYEEKELKSLPVDELISYFAVLNPTFYFSQRHFKISKTTNIVIIKAIPTFKRYSGENIINF